MLLSIEIASKPHSCLSLLLVMSLDLDWFHLKKKPGSHALQTQFIMQVESTRCDRHAQRWLRCTASWIRRECPGPDGSQVAETEAAQKLIMFDINGLA